MLTRRTGGAIQPSLKNILFLHIYKRVSYFEGNFFQKQRENIERSLLHKKLDYENIKNSTCSFFVQGIQTVHCFKDGFTRYM